MTDYMYSDVDMELTRQTDGDVQKDTDTDAVINSLNNIIATLQGGRRMIPEFAQDVWSLLFEPLDDDTARMIAERILDAIRIWEDRVEVITINIDTDFDANLYNLRLEFIIKPLEEIKAVKFVLFTQ
jgi:phage baseplate assembly protein W